MIHERTDLLAGTLREGLQALADGRHGDPFAILGRHQHGDITIVRGLFPGALSVSAIEAESGKVLARLEPIHEAGIFAGAVTGTAAYIFRVKWPDMVQETEDPYSFGPLLGELDLHLIGQGTHYDLGRTLGAVPMEIDGVDGVRFAVWAPNARRVSVVGDFNAWDGRRHPMRLRQQAGIWELFVPRLTHGERYKFELLDAYGNLLPQKADPVARASEAAPSTASIVASSRPFRWNDDEWMRARRENRGEEGPISVYEVHLGSWLRIAEEGNRSLDWVELSQRLVPYVKNLGFTHIEMLPIMEHPFGGSWGYQPLGLFAPTGRHGTPEDFAYFIDRCHQAGIGVILDWVPAHFPTDVWGLAKFDGTALYEHADPREGFHKDWNTLIYNLGRNEVKGFLLASALEWLEHFHVDALRVDAVASMLYLDYSRKEGEWVPNEYGGRENLETVRFLQKLNSLSYGAHPGVMTIAEESTSWPKVSHPVHEGGLGFGFKWNMGFMHDTLNYLKHEPIHRKHHHNEVTFGMVYAYSENFVLPLSHDEVVHGKGSLIAKMAGDDWQKFANLRAYYGFMWGYPGKKLLFMGQEFAQWSEWSEARSLDWNLLQNHPHEGMRRLVRDLNICYRSKPALHARDCEPEGFRWLIADDADNSVFAWLRMAPGEKPIAVITNFTPVYRENYRVPLPTEGKWREILNSDAEIYGGSGKGNGGRVQAVNAGGSIHAEVTLPPLATLMLELEHDPENLAVSAKDRA